MVHKLHWRLYEIEITSFKHKFENYIYNKTLFVHMQYSWYSSVKGHN